MCVQRRSHGGNQAARARWVPAGRVARASGLALLLALGLATGPAAPARGQEEALPAPAEPAPSVPSRPDAGAPGAPSGGPVALDRLLQLPSSRTYTVDRRGGFTEGEWRNRFQEVRKALAGERAALAEAEGRLDKVASSTDTWKMAPPVPGMESGNSEAPLDFKLRTEIRRHQNEIDRLEHRLRELEIEANLAGVPEEWRT